MTPVLEPLWDVALAYSAGSLSGVQSDSRLGCASVRECLSTEKDRLRPPAPAPHDDAPERRRERHRTPVLGV